MKQCTRCKEELELTDFNRDSSKPDGLKSQCRVCAKMAAIGRVEKKKTKLAQDASIELAKKLIREGRCTDNTLRKRGVPQGQIAMVIRQAEASWVNDAMRLFAPPTRTEADG